MKKRFLRICLICAALCALLCVTAAADSGTCGDNLTWTLDNGVLTISGTGAMEDYDKYNDIYAHASPWYGSDLSKITIGGGGNNYW